MEEDIPSTQPSPTIPFIAIPIPPRADFISLDQDVGIWAFPFVKCRLARQSPASSLMLPFEAGRLKLSEGAGTSSVCNAGRRVGREARNGAGEWMMMLYIARRVFD